MLAICLLLLGADTLLMAANDSPTLLVAMAPADSPCRCGNCDCGGAPCNCSAPASAPQPLGRAPVVDPVPSIVESSNAKEKLISGELTYLAQVDDSAVEQVVLYEVAQSCGPGGCSSTATFHPTIVAQPSARVSQGACSSGDCSSGSCGASTFESGACASGSCGTAMQGGRRFRPIRGAGRLLFGRRGGCR